MASSRVRRLGAFALALLFATLMLAVCSKSSPLYPINDWSDANIYLSVGKGMLRGQVTYRDLYDHKGPLLYALHALCALVSPMDFTGVFALEVLCAAAFMLLADRLLRLYGAGRLRACAVALLAALIYASFSFQQGDSAEELCLPLLLCSLYGLLRHLKTDGDAPMPFARVALHGLLFGCVFWTKFTLCGLYAGFCATLAVEAIARRGWRRLVGYIGAFALGFALSTLPWLVYFGLNGAIGDWLKTYLYDNLFLYSGSEQAGLLSRVKEMGKSGLNWLWRNLWYTLPLAFGLIWGVARKGAARHERLALILTASLAALGVFAGGKSYPYYGLALAAFAPLGLIAPCRWARRLAERMAARNARVPLVPRGLRIALCAGFAALCLGAAYFISPNPRESMGAPREQTMQYQFAAVMAQYDHPTLLNYGFMDAGFFTASGITPSVKYFHQTNVPLEQMLSEQIRYIDEGVCDFVVTRGKQPASIDRRYELVAVADSPKGFWYEHVYLYKLKGL